MVANVQKQPPELFYKKGVLKNWTKFIGKHLCQSLFFKKNCRPKPLVDCFQMLQKLF